MLKHLACSTCALAIFLTGCGGGGSDPVVNPGVGFAAALRDSADCAEFTLADADNLLRLFRDLVNAIDTDTSVGDISWGGGAYGAPTVDLDGDGLAENVTGSVTPLGTPTPTIPPFSDGDMVQVTWDIAGATLRGMGVFEFERVGTNVRITQAGNLIESADCQLNLTNLNLTIDPAAAGSLNATGTIEFTLTATPGDTLTGTVTFTGTNTAQINATFRGQNVSLSVDLTTFQVTIL